MATHYKLDIDTLAQAMHDVCNRPQDFTKDEIAAVMDATIQGLVTLPPARRALVELVLARRSPAMPAKGAA